MDTVKSANKKGIMKNIRVYVIDCSSDFNFRFHEQKGDYEAIMKEAEIQGGVYSLDHFEKEINSENLDLSNSFIYISNKPVENY